MNKIKERDVVFDPKGLPHPGRVGSGQNDEAYVRGAGILCGPQQHALSQGPVHGLPRQLFELLLVLQDVPPAGGHPNLWRQEGLVTEGPERSSHWNVATSSTVGLDQSPRRGNCDREPTASTSSMCTTSWHTASMAAHSLFGFPIQQQGYSHSEEAKAQRSEMTCCRQWQV